MTGDTPVSAALYKHFLQVPLTMTLADLSARFDKEHFALVVANQQRYRDGGNIVNNVVICGVVSRIDLLRFIADGQGRPSSIKSIPPTPTEAK